jgi:hypothetical protein
MSDDEQRLLEEIDFWLRFNNDYLLRHGQPPTRRMQEALFHALDRMRRCREAQANDQALGELALSVPVSQSFN